MIEANQYVEKTLTESDPIPQIYLSSADFILEEIDTPNFKELSEEQKKEELSDLLAKTVSTYTDKDVDPDHIEYLWQRLRFKIKPISKKNLQAHERLSLARAIYIYVNLLEVIPEGEDRLPLDEAIEKYVSKEVPSEESVIEAKKIFEEAEKYSKLISKSLRPYDLKTAFEKLKYDEKAMFSISRYFREFRNSSSTIDFGDKKELDTLIRAIEIHKKTGPFKENPVLNFIEETNGNTDRVLTGFEKK